MLRFICLLGILFTVTGSGYAQIIIRQQNSYPLNGSIYLFIEPEQELSINQVQKIYNQNKFKPVKTSGNDLSLGLAKTVYWIAIPLENKTKGNLGLESGIAQSSIFQIEFFLVTLPDGKLISRYKTGANFTVDSRAIITRHYYFPVNLAPGQKAIVFYRIDQRGSSLHIPLRLLNSAYHRAAEVKISQVYAFFCGLVAFVSFFSLITFLWFKDRIYFYYSLYALSCCFFILSDSNLASLWLYPDWILWNSIATTMYACGLVICRLSFTNDFLQLKSTKKKLHRFIYFWMGLIAILVILIPLIFINENIWLRLPLYIFGTICFLGEWAIQVYAISLMVKNRYQPAYLYGLSIFSVFIVSMLYNFRALNIIQSNQLPSYYLLMGFTVEFVILSMALVYKFNFHRKKHSELQLNFQKEILKTQLEIQENTLQNISQEIHDNIGQVLSLVKLNLNTLKHDEPLQASAKVKQSNELLTQAIHDLRELSHNLNADFITHLGLVKALEQQLLALQKTRVYTTQLNVTGEITSYGNEKELVLFRIVQELLNNIVKHAVANRVEINIVFNPGSLFIKITDNGKGFDVDSISKNGHHGIGLINIQKRINLVNGTFHIESSPGSGTCIILNLFVKH